MSHVLLLVSEMYSANGGIQAYMRRLAEILTAYDAGNEWHMDCVSLADSQYVPDRHTLPVTYRTFVGARGSKTIFGLRALRLALGARHQVAVVGHVGLAPAAWVLKRLRLINSYILVLHGTEAWKRLGPADRVSSRGARWIVATTTFTAKEFCRYNQIPETRARIIPLAVPLPAAGTASIGSDLKPGLRVLTVSRLLRCARYKGIDSLIRAVARARAAGANVSLAIAGDGDDVSYLRGLAEDLTVGQYVDFCGPVGDSELAQLYQQCDVFAMPSSGEGFGIVFLEAMNYGKPCIGGNHGGTPEVIDHGRNGFLVEHGDVDQLTFRLIELASDPHLVRALGQRAHEKVQGRFRFSRMQTDWFDLIDKTAAKKPHPGVSQPRAVSAGDS